MLIELPTAAGDLRDSIWKRLNDFGVFMRVSAKTQRQCSEALLDVAREGLDQFAHKLFAAGFEAIELQFGDITVQEKGGIRVKASIIGGSNAVRRKMLELAGSPFTVVLTNRATWERTRGEVTISNEEPKQDGLPLDGAQAPADDMVIDKTTPAYMDGLADGRRGDSRNAERWPQGEAGHADYVLGRQEGERKREARGEGAGDGVDLNVNRPGLADEAFELPRTNSPAFLAGQQHRDTGGELEDNPFDPERQPIARARWAAGWLQANVNLHDDVAIGISGQEAAIKVIGRAAGEADAAPDRCPFPEGWPERSIWLRGWGETPAAAKYSNTKGIGRRRHGEPRPEVAAAAAAAPKRRGRPRRQPSA